MSFTASVAAPACVDSVVPPRLSASASAIALKLTLFFHYFLQMVAFVAAQTYSNYTIRQRLHLERLELGQGPGRVSVSASPIIRSDLVPKIFHR